MAVNEILPALKGQDLKRVITTKLVSRLKSQICSNHIKKPIVKVLLFLCLVSRPGVAKLA